MGINRPTRNVPRNVAVPLLPHWSGPTSLSWLISPDFPVWCPTLTLSQQDWSTHCPQDRFCAFPLVPFCLCWSLGLECAVLYGTNFPNLQDQITFYFLYEAFFSSLQSTSCLHCWKDAFDLYLVHGTLYLCCPLLFQVNFHMHITSRLEGKDHVCFLDVFQTIISPAHSTLHIVSIHT